MSPETEAMPPRSHSVVAELGLAGTGAPPPCPPHPQGCVCLSLSQTRPVSAGPGRAGEGRLSPERGKGRSPSPVSQLLQLR